MPHEAISVFHMFKIGVGPSSSHTLGPWRAALRFIETLKQRNLIHTTTSITVLLYGSLAKTGKGHGTDIAVQLGLSGHDPVTFPTDQINAKIADIAAMKKIVLHGLHEVDFDPHTDIDFLFTESLPYHPNALTFLASLRNGDSIAETYYSVGGGFVIREGEKQSSLNELQLPFPINTADDLLHWCIKTGMAIHEIVMENENVWRNESETRRRVASIW